MKDLPKWFTNNGGTQYNKGGEVSNPFTSATAELNKNELSMYDFIMGCQMVSMTQEVQKNFRRALDWFRIANPEAYMILLD
tara:strand:+ start:639 stop:881 length:243 start_codon:yes stop_codon:yes gene_type:complete